MAGNGLQFIYRLIGSDVLGCRRQPKRVKLKLTKQRYKLRKAKNKSRNFKSSWRLRGRELDLLLPSRPPSRFALSMYYMTCIDTETENSYTAPVRRRRRSGDRDSASTISFSSC